MTWYRVDDELTDSPKLLPLEDDWRLWCDCLALWLAAGVYCARAQTDGRIKRSRLVRLTPMPAARALEVADALVDRAQKDDSEFGLWERDGEDYRFHDWLHYQPSAEEIAKAKESNRKRQQRFRSSRRSKDQQAVHGDDNGTRNALRNGDGNAVTNCVSNATPTRPDPTQISLTTFEMSIPTAGAVDACADQSERSAESAQEARDSSGVHRDTGDTENAAPAPDGEPSELVSDTKAWGRDLAARRKRIGITANELAKYLSVSGRRLTAWEKGAAVPGPEEGAQCMERLGQIERAIGERAEAAVAILNHAAQARYKPTSQSAIEFGLLAWRRSWDEARVQQIIDQRCSEVGKLDGGKFMRPDVVFRKAKVQAIAEQLDAGAVPHNERQPLKGSAFLDRIDEEIAAMRREDEQRRLVQ